MTYQLTPVEFGKWYVSEGARAGRQMPGHDLTVNLRNREDSRRAGPFNDKAEADAKVAELITTDSGLRDLLFVWQSPTAREARRTQLEQCTDEQLDAVVERVLSEGVKVIHRDRRIDTILDAEFPGEQRATVQSPCSRCNKVTPHIATSVRRDPGGQEVQQMQCAVCKTWNIVATGEDGKQFQVNLDTPDNTDFSDLK